MLIDEVEITIKGGDGGDGIASFKNPLMTLGPTGGNGGDGGNVYLTGVSDLGALRQFRHKKRFEAERGKNGSNRNKEGAKGKDLSLSVPVGTVIHNLDLGEDHEVDRVGQRVLVAHGARGGRGNFEFRSSTNTSPREFEYGRKARAFKFSLELKLIADVGLVGLPNAGKSSLLNAMTNASSKVANYQFTTLEPHLGVYEHLILADIPGLIDGASAGKGLGHKFLRHVSRCRVLFHLISSESQDPVKDYQVIRDELDKYDKALNGKIEYVLLTKTDLLEKKQINEYLEKMSSSGIQARPVNVMEEEGLRSIRNLLTEVQQQKIESGTK